MGVFDFGGCRFFFVFLVNVYCALVLLVRRLCFFVGVGLEVGEVMGRGFFCDYVHLLFFFFISFIF